jgi:AcrR family transcriptional regulator
MMGLRARQRADRNHRILKAAACLFREAGYEGARIDAIAAKAEVSIGTIYNYYQNKGDVLVAIVSMEVNEVLQAGQKILEKPPKSIERAVARLFAAYIAHSLVYLSKEMWRQAMATSTQQPESPFGKTYTALDRALTNQVCALVAKLQDLRLVSPEINTRDVGEVLFNNMNMMFIEFVKDEAMTIESLLRGLRRQNRTLLRAIEAKRVA